jgi:hypothetical protein
MKFKRYLKATPIILKYPRTFFLHILRGKAANYRYLLNTILTSLSAKPSGKFQCYLEDSLEAGRLSLPDDLKLFEQYEEIVPLVVLYYLCRVNKPRVVIETGVWTGKSSWFILKALSDNERGKLYSVDKGVRTIGDEKLPTNEIGGFVPKSLRDRWTLLIGDSKDILPKLVRHIGRLDIFFHDSSHTYEHMLFEFRTMWPFIAKQGYLCSDDVSSNNAWIDFMSEIGHSSKMVGKRMGICCKNNSSVV